MNIRIHYTGSSGNLYQIDDLLIEAGVPIWKIKEALDFKLNKVQACLISHSHYDHCRAAKDLLKVGIDVYCSKETARVLSLSGHRLHIIKALQQHKIRPWTVLAFRLIHDVTNYGFLISNGKEKAMYACDSSYIPYRFKSLNYIMLGIDFDTDILRTAVNLKETEPALANRVLRNHMSLKTALDFFRANDMSKVREIHILHLSDVHSDEFYFKKSIEKITGKPVYIAKKE